MFVTQKTQYALRAIFELARRNGQGPAKIAEIAKAQAIPPRFLEVILSQLKQGGFVESQRGSLGGYWLARPANELTVGEIIQFIEGPFGPVECVNDQAKSSECPLHDDCVFLPMWAKVQEAVSQVYDNTTFQDLIEQAKRGNYIPVYSI